MIKDVNPAKAFEIFNDFVVGCAKETTWLLIMAIAIGIIFGIVIGVVVL